MVTIYICYTLNEPTFKKIYFVERIFMSHLCTEHIK